MAADAGIHGPWTRGRHTQGGRVMEAEGCPIMVVIESTSRIQPGKKLLRSETI